MELFYIRAETDYERNLDLFVNAETEAGAVRAWQEYFEDSLEGCNTCFIYPIGGHADHGAISWGSLGCRKFVRGRKGAFSIPKKVKGA